MSCEAGFQLPGCPECGVPDYITSEHRWLDSGAIVQSTRETSRLFFIETGNIDPLHRNIEKIIGRPLEKQIITIKRRAIRSYIDPTVPTETKEQLQTRAIDFLPFLEGLMIVARLMGYGRYDVLSYRYENDADDYARATISDPISVPYACGTMMAVTEIITGKEGDISHKQLRPNLYELYNWISKHPPQYKGRMNLPLYRYKRGDIELDKCPTCGGPRALGRCRWDVDRGIIRSTTTGRRMAMLGPETDSLFEELEKELGDAIPRAVIEAQRQFTRSGFYSTQEVGDTGSVAEEWALRGLGEVRELNISRRSVRVHLKNSGLHLITVGLAQGLFENAFNTESDVEWEVSDGDLRVEVTPKG
jgi:hypothetical protein